MAINIPLLDGYRILSDKHQFILAKEADDRIIHETFHSDIESCIQSFLDMKIRGFNSTSILGLLNSIKSLQTALNKALHPLKLCVVPCCEEVNENKKKEVE